MNPCVIIFIDKLVERNIGSLYHGKKHSVVVWRSNSNIRGFSFHML